VWCRSSRKSTTRVFWIRERYLPGLIEWLS
jgi:hypothetical protein